MVLFFSGRPRLLGGIGQGEFGWACDAGGGGDDRIGTGRTVGGGGDAGRAIQADRREAAFEGCRGARLRSGISLFTPGGAP